MAAHTQYTTEAYQPSHKMHACATKFALSAGVAIEAARSLQRDVCTVASDNAAESKSNADAQPNWT
eukprot:8817282-Alexandrium_andersonii.AAC.1